uniref:Glycosyltransferase 2-like domain-containing protein n=1 Tax=Arcella intermedia TaxID=1963864 RepID=A0A6B2L9F8_9EUKA
MKVKRKLADMGHVCILIRSYHPHINTSGAGLATLYDCLEQFEYENWSSYVFYVDNTPVYDFGRVIEARDEKFRDKHHVVDTPYHYKWECDGDCGYAATDWAIYNICPKETRWLLLTNGDNDYTPDFLSFLDTDYDAIGFNWYTRETNIGNYVPQPDNINQTYCDREWKMGCMKNRWRPRGYDMGTAIWNYPRFIKELKSYSKFSPTCCHDGYLAEDCVFTSGWKARDMPDCLFSHNPNPWSSCMRAKNPRLQT